MPDVFVSYKRRLRPRVELLAGRLRELGIDVWFDAGLEPGMSFGEEINDKLERAKSVIVCWSPDAFKAGGDVHGWVLGEAKSGWDRGVLVPAFFEACRLPPPFNVDHVEDMTLWDGEDSDAFRSVVDRIGKLCGRPGLEPFLDARASAPALSEWARSFPDNPLAAPVLGAERKRAELQRHVDDQARIEAELRVAAEQKRKALEAEVEAEERRLRALSRPKSLNAGGRLPATGVAPAGQTGLSQAPPEIGGYLRANVSLYEGTYIVIRPAFKDPRLVYGYLTDIYWDDDHGGLAFRERNRIDEAYTQVGRVWFPAGSPVLYLVTAKLGWLRSTVLYGIDQHQRMLGLLSTLHNPGGPFNIPTATPIAYLKVTEVDPTALGEFASGAAMYEAYRNILTEVVGNGYVKLVVP